jgi:inhibitor of cysteine peptidase
MNLRIVFCLLLAACAAPRSEDADTAAPQGVVRVTQENSGKSVTLRTGGRMEVALESNATTGYSWQREGGDTAVLATDSSRYQPDRTQPGVVGSGGTQILGFRGARAGRTRLVLVYRQPWNGGGTSDRRWEADVVVQP